MKFSLILSKFLHSDTAKSVADAVEKTIASALAAGEPEIETLAITALNGALASAGIGMLSPILDAACKGIISHLVAEAKKAAQ